MMMDPRIDAGRVLSLLEGSVPHLRASKGALPEVREAPVGAGIEVGSGTHFLVLADDANEELHVITFSPLRDGSLPPASVVLRAARESIFAPFN
jgi:hypothetical protein